MAQIIWFAGDFAPKYWALCNGQTLAINTNQALFSLLGTTYGGNGTTTFNLPDFRGRLPVGTGNGAGLSPVVLGEVSGAESTVMLSSQMPAHTHDLIPKVSSSLTAGSSDEADQNLPAQTAANNFAPVSAANNTMGGVSIAITPAGSGAGIPLVKPYVGINAIICINGIYPSRN